MWTVLKKGALEFIFGDVLVLVLIDYEFTVATASALKIMSLIGLSIFLFDAHSVFQILTVVSTIGIMVVGIFKDTLSAKGSPLEIALITRAIIPNKFTLSMLFPLKVTALIVSPVVLFFAVTLGLLVHPTSFIPEVSCLVCVDSLVIACAYQVAAVVVDEKSISKVWLELLVYNTLEVAQEITIFFHPVSLYISPRQLVFKHQIFIGVYEVERVLQFPYLAVCT